VKFIEKRKIEKKLSKLSEGEEYDQLKADLLYIQVIMVMHIAFPKE